MNAPLKLRRLLGAVAVLAAMGILAAACGSDDVAAVDPDAPSSADGESADDAESESEDGDAEAGGDTAGGSDDDDDAMADDGDSDADDDAMEDDVAAVGDYPRDIETSAGTVTVAAKPASIVSLSPTATEMLFAIGAGDQVVAVDQYSNYPATAPEPTLDGFAPDLEAILAASPDLVVASGLPDDIVAALGGADVPVLLLPAAASFDDTYDQIAQLGVATDQIDGAATVNADVRSGVDEVLAGLPEIETPIRVFHEIDDSFYTATSNTFIGQVYKSMGFENVADPLDDGFGYPLVDGESIIAADPSLIVFTSQATYSAEDIIARPGWDTTTAVTEGNVVQVDADIASRWGPRIVEFMQEISDVISVDA